jgi:hypothetical protein
MLKSLILKARPYRPYAVDKYVRKFFRPLWELWSNLC